MELRISQDKTNVMRIGENDQNSSPITIGGRTVEDTNSFVYLGSVLAKDGGTDDDVRVWIGKAAAVVRKMGKFWTSTKIDLKIKLQLYSTIVLPTALYASETWRQTGTITRKLNTFHQRCLRKSMKISNLDLVTYEEVLRQAQSRRMQAIVTERRLRMADHVLRLSYKRPAKNSFKWKPDAGKGRKEDQR